TVNPHMHLLGKSFIAYAVTPQNDTIPLVSIPKWDFRWQYFYTFKKVQKIPASSRIIAEATYDNTEYNPNNPYNPPQVIIERSNPFESMKTTNEMFQFIFTYMSYQTGDENISLENISLE
ncbi:MAG: cytochrome c, partial [Chitinophagales bacterium]|nr:cytochrome c [Chitinophagales bacterium]